MRRRSASALATTTSGSSEWENGALVEDQGVRRVLREQLQHLRSDMCRTPNDVEDANRLFAFTPCEVRIILESAVTPAERLVVTLNRSCSMKSNAKSPQREREYVCVLR